jgi:hypothetical protein
MCNLNYDYFFVGLVLDDLLSRLCLDYDSINTKMQV